DDPFDECSAGAGNDRVARGARSRAGWRPGDRRGAQAQCGGLRLLGCRGPARGRGRGQPPLAGVGSEARRNGSGCHAAGRAADRHRAQEEAWLSVSGARGLDSPVPPGLHGSAASFTDRTGRGLYVYCITEAEEPLDLGLAGLGEGGGPVFSVHHGGLAAVVGEALPIECRRTRENLLSPELVDAAVVRRHAGIPRSCGTLVGTEADVAPMLRSAGGALSEILGGVRGKIELGLKVTWDREKALAQLEAEDP